ncbi:MAG: glutathione peroxidase [Acidaminococcaceae bacterium]
MNIYDFSVAKPNGALVSLSAYKGQVMVIANTASKCGFTGQYKDLQGLYEKYKDQGFIVLAFPSNQFANQEPGANEEIQHFCQINYGVKFPVFAKIDVKGATADPLFKYLIKEAPGFINDDIKWNFTKFLIDRTGKVHARYAPIIPPSSMEKTIVELLAKG